MSRSPFIQVKYNTNSLEGLVMQDLKNSERNASRVVRNCMTKIRGYQVLKSVGVSHQELIEFCVENVQFFHAQHEIAKINLEQELKNNYQYNSAREKIIIPRLSHLLKADEET